MPQNVISCHLGLFQRAGVKVGIHLRNGGSWGRDFHFNEDYYGDQQMAERNLYSEPRGDLVLPRYKRF
jgi:hypothetical protein